MIARPFLSLLALLTFVIGSAQEWTGAVDSDWNNAANWSDWPLGGQDITLDPANLSGASALPVIGSASVFTPERVYVEGLVLTIEAALNAERFIVSAGQVQMTAGTLTSDRVIVEMTGAFHLTGGTVNATSVLALGDGGSFIQDGGTVNANDEMTFECETGAFDHIYAVNDGILVVEGDLVWFGEAPGSGRPQFNVNGGVVELNGNVMNTVGSTVDMQVVLNGGTVTTRGQSIELAHATDSIVMNGSAVLHIEGDATLDNDGVFWSTGGDVFIDGGTELRGNGSYRFPNMTISEAATLQQTDPAEIELVGNWTRTGAPSGSFDPGQNNIAFVGEQAQGITATAFHGLRVANTGAGLYLTGHSSLTGPLVLETGIIHTLSNDLLVLLDNATASGASAASHVDGPMQKIGDDEFIFPTGDGGRLGPIGIGSIAGTTTLFTAEFLDAPFTNTTDFGPGITDVSQVEHWTLTRSATTDEAQVYLFWEDASTSGLVTCDGLALASWDGALWQAVPSAVTGPCSGDAAGYIGSTSTVSTFQAFTLAASSGSIGIAQVDPDASVIGIRHDAPYERLLVAGLRNSTALMVLDAKGTVHLVAQVSPAHPEVAVSGLAPGVCMARLFDGIRPCVLRFVVL
jgi:hypothetical protein